MEIVTRRLVLREFTTDDAAAFLAYQADPRYAEFYAPDEVGPEHGRALLDLFARWAAERPRRNYQLAIAERRDPHGLLGCCGLRLLGRDPGTAELGLELAASCWGRGYATEAARALLAFGFRELALDEVRGLAVSANARVVALARRLGLVEIAAHPGPAWMRARGWAETEWQLTRTRWEV